MSATLLIRADASLEMGTGHIMRCLSLAEQWILSGGNVKLASAQITSLLEQRAKNIGIEVLSIVAMSGSQADARETVCVANQLKADWLVVDGYQFDTPYQRELKTGATRLLWVDDFGHASEHFTDVVLNQNLGATPALYPKIATHTKLLLGCRYAILRQEFLKWQRWQRIITHPARKLLVTLGGSDHENITYKVAQALKLIEHTGIQATIVVGGSYPHRPSLEAILAGTPHRLLQNVNNMPELMAEADMAIGAGGTTTWEFAFMGLPTLMIIMADNQVFNCEQMAKHGTAINLGWHHTLNPQQIAQGIENLSQDRNLSVISDRARKLVDGYGSLRIWRHLNERSLRLRPVNESDCRRIWEWANDPEVRAVSFASAAIPWERHFQWFSKQLEDSRCRFWIAENIANEPLGQVRFELTDLNATISVSLIPTARGHNQGSLLIWIASRKVLRENPHIEKVLAYIKPENKTSVRAFQKAGFELLNYNVVIKGFNALCCELTRHNAEL